MRDCERRLTTATTAHLASNRAKGGTGNRCEGYAAVHYVPGDPGTEYVLWDMPGNKCIERLMPGCFEDVLRNNPDTICAFNHNYDLLLARTSNGTLTLKSDRIGLWYGADLDETDIGQRVQRYLQRGDVTGSSFGFWIADDGETWSDQKLPNGTILTIREITKIKALADASPVVMPAYTGTSAGIRIDGNNPDTLRAPQKTVDPALAARLEAYRQRAADVTAQASGLSGRLAAYKARARAVSLD